jgi:IclR family acetate operon transcriptional repressor
MLAGSVGPGRRGLPRSRATRRAVTARHRHHTATARNVPKIRIGGHGGLAASLTSVRRTGHSCCVQRPDVAVSATYQSAERVLALLTSFDDARPELGVTEMAALIGVHKSTASRLASALERAGLLTRSGRRYRLGVEAIRLGMLALRGFDLVASLQPAMDRLAAETGETVNLAVPDGSAILNVAEVPSAYILSSSGGWTGRRTTPHAVANGKVLMAYGAIAVPPSLERYTAQTITAPDLLAAELAAVRGRGYATAVAELEEGLVAVASPVFDGTGACVAALSVSGPAYRMKPETLDELGQLCAAASATGSR